MSVGLMIGNAAALFDQTQSFPIRAMNVCLCQKPPGGFRDPSSTPLMVESGLGGEWRLCRSACNLLRNALHRKGL
jgi:hypothetical protein